VLEWLPARALLEKSYVMRAKESRVICREGLRALPTSAKQITKSRKDSSMTLIVIIVLILLLGGGGGYYGYGRWGYGGGAGIGLGTILLIILIAYLLGAL
jgi:hypothetical protein